MWLLQIFKDTLNASFDYFLNKVKGRFLAFVLQFIVSYLAAAIFTLLITIVVVTALNQGHFSLDLFSMEGLFEWMRMIDPVWLVTSVIAVNFLFKSKGLEKKMSFPDFYKNKSSQFWLDLVIAVAAMAVILTIYYKNELFLSFDASPLDVLLTEGFVDFKSPLETLLSSWIYYTVIALPIIAVIIIEIRDRKRDGVQMKTPIWQVLVSAVVLSFIINWTFESFSYMFGELVLNLIYAPFEMIEIPAFFGVISAIFFRTLNFIVLAAIIHFILQFNMEKVISKPVSNNNLNEL